MKPAPEEPMSESLRDVEELSLKFSIDVDFKANGEMDMARRQYELVEILSRKANSISKPIVSYSPGSRPGYITCQKKEFGLDFLEFIFYGYD